MFNDYDDYAPDDDGMQQQEMSEAQRWEDELANDIDAAYDRVRSEEC
jgi:hypothetical protein